MLYIVVRLVDPAIDCCYNTDLGLQTKLNFPIKHYFTIEKTYKTDKKR